MNRTHVLILILFLIIAGLSGFMFWKNAGPAPGRLPVQNGDDDQPDTSVSEMVRLTVPKAGDAVKSPLTVRGEARGTWFFEASFPIRIVDSNGQMLGQSFVQAQDEWMTTQFVPFAGTITFATSTTATGELILEKDNPSGLPEHAAEVRIPIQFAAATSTLRTVQLYYYDPTRDTDPAGNLLCSAQGLVAVSRRIPVTSTPIQDAIRLLMRGDLTEAERARGVATEFPLSGVNLEGASLNQGELRLALSDPQGKTNGGACRVSILRTQIERTAKQFPEVQRVVFRPEGCCFEP